MPSLFDYNFFMSRLKLRRFQTADQVRLGALLTKAKDGHCSEAEDAELLSLLGRARRVSVENTRRISVLRGNPSTQEPEPTGL